jgi:hypothetical protein
VVAESVLVKHQLLILNRSRKPSPHLRPADRVVAGLCAVFIRPRRLVRSAIVFKADSAEVSPAFSSNRPMKPGPKAQPGRHRRRRPHETPEPELGVSMDLRIRQSQV